MGTITTTDGTDIFYKDRGTGQPIVFSRGWPLSADDWDTAMMFFLLRGYRVVAHDRHGEDRVARAVLISSVPPLMLKTDANPGGLPKDVFDGLQEQVATNRSRFCRDFAAGPFYGFNRPGVESSEAIIENWWRQGMMGGAKAHYDGIVAFSQTDFTGDLKQISTAVLVMHGDGDQVVPYADSGPLTAKLVMNGTLKAYYGYPHGMPTTHADVINADLLAWLQARPSRRDPQRSQPHRLRRSRWCGALLGD
jgi:non-heme chloroperoxidase